MVERYVAYMTPPFIFGDQIMVIALCLYLDVSITLFQKGWETIDSCTFSPAQNSPDMKHLNIFLNLYGQHYDCIVSAEQAETILSEQIQTSAAAAAMPSAQDNDVIQNISDGQTPNADQEFAPVKPLKHKAEDVDPVSGPSKVSLTAKVIKKTLLETTRSNVQALKSTRVRAESNVDVKSFTCDPFSFVHFAAIGVTKDLAMKDIFGCKKSVYIPGKVVRGAYVVNQLFGKELEDKLLELTVRLKVIDNGVDPALAPRFLVSSEWKAHCGYFVNGVAGGEVMNKKGKLLGSLQKNKFHLSDIYKKGDRPSRAQFVLESAGEVFEKGDTPDHIDSTQPLNDSISNLRVLDKHGQIKNQKRVQKSVYTSTYTGNLLPKHPILRSIKLSDTGLANAGQGWYMGCVDKSTDDLVIFVDGAKFKVHKLMVEAKLGRILVAGLEDVDHINGVHTNNSLSNLRPLLKVDNIMKTTVKLITRVDAKGKAVVFGSREIAAEVTRCLPGNITPAIKSGQEYARYTWKDSSVAEIAEFFRQMDLIVMTQDFSHLSSNPRYANLLKSIKLFFEWNKAISS